MASYYKNRVFTRDFDEKKAKVEAAAKQLAEAKSAKTKLPATDKKSVKKA